MCYLLKKIKSYYFEITQESQEVFKNSNETTLRNNLKEWAEEKCFCAKKHMLMSLNNLKDVSLSYGLAKLKKKINL